MNTQIGNDRSLKTMKKRKPKPSVPNPCSVCGIPIFGSLIGTGDGTMKDGGSFAHPECYWRDLAGKLMDVLREFQRHERAAAAVCPKLDHAYDRTANLIGERRR